MKAIEKISKIFKKENITVSYSHQVGNRFNLYKDDEKIGGIDYSESLDVFSNLWFYADQKDFGYKKIFGDFDDHSSVLTIMDILSNNKLFSEIMPTKKFNIDQNKFYSSISQSTRIPIKEAFSYKNSWHMLGFQEAYKIDDDLNISNVRHIFIVMEQEACSSFIIDFKNKTLSYVLGKVLSLEKEIDPSILKHSTFENFESVLEEWADIYAVPLYNKIAKEKNIDFTPVDSFENAMLGFQVLEMIHV